MKVLPLLNKQDEDNLNAIFEIAKNHIKLEEIGILLKLKSSIKEVEHPEVELDVYSEEKVEKTKRKSRKK